MWFSSIRDIKYSHGGTVLNIGNWYQNDTMASPSYPSPDSIDASPALLGVLQDLHAQAAAEEAYVSTKGPAASAIDKFVALDPDKCAAVYLLLRSTGARHVVEAGTSFGLSTIYLALAVGQNAGGDPHHRGRVIATEHEAAKAVRAREHWKRAGAEVEPFIELREGDILQTLKSGLPEEVDFLLLDSTHSTVTLAPFAGLLY